VTSIEPGNTETEFSVVRFKGDENKAGAVYSTEEQGVRAACTGNDIAEIINFATHVCDTYVFFCFFCFFCVFLIKNNFTFVYWDVKPVARSYLCVCDD
jgi:hypothetical protein